MPLTHTTLLEAIAQAQTALQLIASPVRADGTYNRDRRACEQLAREALLNIDQLLQSPPSVSEALEAAPARPLPSAAPAPRLNSWATPTLESTATPEKASSPGTGPFVVYSDGGCHGNPGPAGWGVVVLQGGRVVEVAGGFLGHQTNQLAELEAAIAGLTRTPAGSVVELVSDSQYVLKGVSEWRKGWETRGWLNANKQPVANKAIWQRLFALADARQVKVRWVRGHTGDPHNERCDELARQAIEQRAELLPISDLG